MPQIRTRMQPGVVIDVSEEEAAVLAAGGLLAPAPEPVAPANTTAPKTKTKTADQPPAATPEPTTDPVADGAEATTTKKKG